MLSIAALFVVAGGALMGLNVALGGFFIIVGLVIAFIAWRNSDGLGIQVKSYDIRDIKQSQYILNKQDLILAIAEFEMQADRIYHSKSYNVPDYDKACDDLRQQIRIAGFAGDNPVVELYQLRSAVDYKLGNMNGGAGMMLFKHNWQFAGALHNAATSARQWVETANSQDSSKEVSHPK